MFVCQTQIYIRNTIKDVFIMYLIPANPRKSAPSIKVRFPAETYTLAGHAAHLECFAYGK